MARKSIFIASAAESLDLAKVIAQELAKRGYDPLRWWNEFPAQDFTLDRLLEISRVVDGAVLICEGVDQRTLRGTQTTTPRDNVIFEYGIFVTSVGRKRTLVLSNKNTSLPSDVAALTYESILEDSASVAERTVAYFDQQFADSLPPLQSAVRLVADSVIIDQQLRDPLPDSWHQRDLYFGIEGARGWLAAINDPAYAPAAHEQQLRMLILDTIRGADVRTFVSFGPGDAVLDKDIAITLTQSEPWLQYIPVDISDGLLQHAANELSDHVRVPIGILGDFEDRLNFIDKQLRQHAISPTLFSLLGNTIGNLDRLEESFLRTLKRMMKKGDFLLLDASLAGVAWERSSDRRGKHDSYGAGYRRFIATGVGRRAHVSIESIVETFEERIQFGDGRSDIPKTNTITIVDGPTGRLTQTIRRYNFDSLTTWLKERIGFRILKSSGLFIDEKIGDCVILAQL
jgi:hypothetical protein